MELKSINLHCNASLQDLGGKMGNKWVEKKNRKKKGRREQFRYYQMQVRTLIKVSGTRICMS